MAPRMMVMWGGAGSFIDPVDSRSEDAATKAYVDRCARHGVTRLIPSGLASETMVEAADRRGIVVHPYFAFNFQGGLVLFQWSLDYALPLPYTAEAREMLDRHRPVWRTPRAVPVRDYARAHPEHWALERGGTPKARPGRRISLSLAFPGVMSHLVSGYLALLDTSGVSGVQVEFVTGDRDQDGVEVTGYEHRMVDAFIDKHGISPLALGNDDRRWMRFRAGYVTEFLKELRRAVKEASPGASVSTTMVARDGADYLKSFLDWEAWIDQGLVDELYLWFRSERSTAEVERRTKEVAGVVDGRCPLIAELSCYHPGSFQRPEELLEAARRALGGGADAVGVYGSDAVEQLGLWPVVEQMAGL